MEDKAVQFSGQQADEAPVSAPAAAETKNLTEADVKRIIGEAVSELNRQQQGLAKKRENRILSEVTKRLEAVRASGVEMNPQQQQALQQATANQVIQELDEGEPEQVDQPVKTKQPEKISEIERARRELCEEYGKLEITQNDPEAAEIDQSSPRKFLKSYEAALKAKQERQAATEEQPTNPRARMPMMGGGGTAAGATENDYRTAMLAARGKPGEVAQVKEKYRKLGVDVDQVQLFPKR